MMITAGTGIRRWRSLSATVALGVLGLSLTLPDAPAGTVRTGSRREARRPEATGRATRAQAALARVDGALQASTPADAGVTSDESGRVVRTGTLRRIDKQVLPYAAPVVVDYRNDEPSQRRARGELVGPDRRPPAYRNVAGAGCSFDIDCDDCDPCTQDRCLIANVCDAASDNAGASCSSDGDCPNGTCLPPGGTPGSGTCSNVVVPNRTPTTGCGDGVFCNGIETCQDGVCEAPGEGTGVATGILDAVPCLNLCAGGDNNEETCGDDGDCPGGSCAAPACEERRGECFISCAIRRCSDESVNPNAVCTGDGDCPDGHCNTPDENCDDGAQCNGSQSCDLDTGVCQFEDVNPCGVNADCEEGATPTCFAGRCCTDGGGDLTCTPRRESACLNNNGLWFAGAPDGRTGRDQCDPNVGFGCPSYSAGLAPNGEFLVSAGPISQSPCGDLFELGDDYALNTDNHLALDVINISGSMEFGLGTRLNVSFYDSDGNFVEDIQFISETNGVAFRRQATLQIQYIELIPPMPIPPDGFVVFHMATAFSPNGRFYIATTDTEDVGTNDPNKLWVDGAEFNGDFIQQCVGGTNDGFFCNPRSGGSDCPGGACENRPGVLAFELIGTEIDPPVTACCEAGTGVCNSELEWVCSGRGDHPIVSLTPDGERLPRGCGLCSDGIHIGENARTCDSGANAGLLCLGADDCPGGSCVCDNTQCPGLCTDFSTECTSDGDCPGGETCAGILPGVCDALLACETGGCCDPDTGTCTDGETAATCTAPREFLGLGTDCEPNCCEQPQFTGGDNCDNVTINHVTVPEEPICVGGPNNGMPCSSTADCAGRECARTVVITVSGDNSNATGPDSCNWVGFDENVNTPVNLDLGWWEAVSIDACAFLIQDMCCSNPVHEPQWTIAWDECPCEENAALTARINPNLSDLDDNARRGAPFCDEDNLWSTWGPLSAGTYWFPILTDLAGAIGPYQMHFTVMACPDAACCLGENCQLLNQVECAEAGGVFLAPPSRTEAVTFCTASTCATGSCCTGPGECEDREGEGGPLVTRAACDNLSGTYTGGLRCAGGTCDNDANESCADDADCGAGGACVGTLQELEQPSPCPICEVGSSATCQDIDDYYGWRLADKCIADCVADPTLPEAFTADDFIALENGEINTVCITGQWFDQGDGGDCYTTGPNEQFFVTIYDDANGVPGEPVVAEQEAQVIASGLNFFDTQNPPVHHIEYSLRLNTPVTVSADNIYWLSLAGNSRSDLGGSPFCDFAWNYSNPGEGNDYSAQNWGEVWAVEDVLNLDMAFCTNVAIDTQVDRLRACCTCGDVDFCEVTTFTRCETLQGHWIVDQEDCTGFTCPTTRSKENDFCSSAIVVSDVEDMPVNNFCTTGSPAPLDNLTCENEANRLFNVDLWYHYTALCTGDVTVSTCGENEPDTMLAVYSDGTATCVCPSDNSTQVGDCSDDGCVFNGAGSEVQFTAQDGVCYTIRVGGFGADEDSIGLSQLTVVNAACPSGNGGGEAPDPLAGDPSDADSGKNRYLSFSAPASATAGASEEAIRITLDDVAGFDGFNGEVRFVGQPQEHIDEGLGTFIAAPLQCEPFFTDWSGFDLINVYGAEIVPGSSYTAQRADVSCSSLDDEGCFSDALTIETAKWGDVAPTYFAPGGPAQPDFGDISALVDKFTAAPTSPPKARAQLQPSVPKPQDAISFTDIANCIDAFTGAAFPYAGPSACP